MTVLETFRMPTGGGLVVSESVTLYGPAAVCTKDLRRSRRVATAGEPGPA